MTAKKRILTFALLIAVALGMNGQILWKISGNGLAKPSYLLGTHHLAPVSVLDNLEGFDRILGEVDKVMGEVVMCEMSSPSAQQLLINVAMAPADSALSVLLSQAQMDSLTTVLQRYMGPTANASMFEQLKPSMVSTTLGLVQTQVAFPEFNASQQLDGVVQQRAVECGKEVGGLETIEEQCAVLFGGSLASQAADLMDAVRNDSEAITMAKDLAKAYMSGDLDAILATIENPQITSPEAANRLIYTRNANWLRALAALLPTASVLIAVGAGHLPGDKGLISLLRKEGYDVEKM